jgi:S1-C subfamily serine protease
MPAGSVVFRPNPATRKTGVNGFAIASLICAIAGIPFFGILTGLAAVLLAIVALSAIRAQPQRGLGVALSGLLLGIIDVVGWVIFLTVMLSRGGSPLSITELPPDLKAIGELEPPLERAMRANVLIERSAGLAALGGKSVGSGVILSISQGEALIVTNRHVVDDEFPRARDDTRAKDDLSSTRLFTVRMLGQKASDGQVVWLAPDQIDLALIRTAWPLSSEAKDAAWRKGRPMKVGQPVFAIGNPYQLGWTHTQGMISQLRTQTSQSRQVRVIQTDVALNPGNSGGGLYDQEGYLLGINTWKTDMRANEGFGFAIALDALVELAPQLVAQQPEKTETPAGSGGAREPK